MSEQIFTPEQLEAIAVASGVAVKAALDAKDAEILAAKEREDAIEAEVQKRIKAAKSGPRKSLPKDGDEAEGDGDITAVKDLRFDHMAGTHFSASILDLTTASPRPLAR